MPNQSTQIIRYEQVTQVNTGSIQNVFRGIYIDSKGEEAYFALDAKAVIYINLDTRTYDQPEVSMGSSGWDLEGMIARTRCLLLAIECAKEMRQLVGHPEVEVTPETAYSVIDVTEKALALPV